ncbi:MAG: hypothetical protein ACK5XN_37545, partial [Bacteroidota bacterium]
IQSFCISEKYENLKFPEMQIFQVIVESDFYKQGNYEIYLVTNDGRVLNERQEYVGLSRDFDLDFIVYTHDAVTIDAYRVATSYVMPEFLIHEDFLIVSCGQSQACLIADLIDNYQHKTTSYAAPDYKSSLITPKQQAIFYNFGQAKIIEPSIYKNQGTTKLAYISMSDPLLRHRALILSLDKTNLCAFYGPKDKWQNISSYVGSPEYGDDIYKILNKQGVCLAIHSPIHEFFNLHTTRFAEGCMAGAVIITDEYEHFREIFGDSIFMIDFTRPVEDCVNDIKRIMKWIRENPKDANDMAKKSQAIFCERYLKKDWILDLCTTIEKTKEDYISKMHAAAMGDVIDVIYTHQSNNPNVVDYILDQLLRQYHKNINFIVVCQEKDKSSLEEKIKAKLSGVKQLTYSIVSTGVDGRKINKNNTGTMFLMALEHLKGKFFTFIDVNTLWNK